MNYITHQYKEDRMQRMILIFTIGICLGVWATLAYLILGG